MVFLWKFCGEILYDDLSADLWMHHAAEMVAVTLVLSDKYDLGRHADVVVRCMIIQLPLLIRDAQKLLSPPNGSLLDCVLDGLYLVQYLLHWDSMFPFLITKTQYS